MCMAMILEALCESFITRHIYYRSYPNNTRSISCALKSSQLALYSYECMAI